MRGRPNIDLLAGDLKSGDVLRLPPRPRTPIDGEGLILPIRRNRTRDNRRRRRRRIRAGVGGDVVGLMGRTFGRAVVAANIDGPADIELAYVPEHRAVAVVPLVACAALMVSPASVAPVPVFQIAVVVAVLLVVDGVAVNGSALSGGAVVGVRECVFADGRGKQRDGGEEHRNGKRNGDAEHRHCGQSQGDPLQFIANIHFRIIQIPPFSSKSQKKIPPPNSPPI